MTARGSKAPLSPHEEVSLRRVALGFGQETPERHLLRLALLGLIERSAAGPVLTALGRQRYQALDRPLNRSGDAQPDEIAAVLDAFVKSRDTGV